MGLIPRDTGIGRARGLRSIFEGVEGGYRSNCGHCHFGAIRYAKHMRYLVAGLLIAAGSAPAQEISKTNPASWTNAEAELDRAAAEAGCAAGTLPCVQRDRGEKIAEGPERSIIQLLDAGRRCGATEGATISSAGGKYTSLFWKRQSVDDAWRACFRAAAHSMGIQDLLVQSSNP